MIIGNLMGDVYKLFSGNQIKMDRIIKKKNIKIFLYYFLLLVSGTFTIVSSNYLLNILNTLQISLLW